MAEQEKQGTAAAEAQTIDLGEFSDLLEKDFRVKEDESQKLQKLVQNLALAAIQSVPWDRRDARNHGVTEDRRVRTRGGLLLRVVCYTHPETGEPYEFLRACTKRLAFAGG